MASSRYGWLVASVEVVGWALEGGEVMVKPPGLEMPGTKTSSHCPGRNYMRRTWSALLYVYRARAAGGEAGGCGGLSAGLDSTADCAASIINTRVLDSADSSVMQGSCDFGRQGAACVHLDAGSRLRDVEAEGAN